MKTAINNLIADLRSMPRPVWYLLAGQFINRFGTFVFPFFTLYLDKRGLSGGQIATVLAAMSVGFFLGPIASGYLSDAIGRRNTIAISLFGSAAFLMVLYVCERPLWIAVVAVVYGCLHFLYGPAASALLTDLVPAEKRATAFALLRLAVNAGFAAGPSLAGLLFAKAPVLIFVGDALSTVIFGIIALAGLPHGLRSIKGNVTSLRVVLGSWKEALADMIANRPFVQFIAATIMVGSAFTQVFNVFAITATDNGLPASAYGMVMGLNGLLIVLIELPLTRWMQRFPVRRVLATGYALIGVGCALFGIMNTFTGYLLAMCVFTLGEILALPIGMAYSSNLAPDAYRGRYFGMRGMAWGISSFVGSSGVWLHSRIGDSWWLIVGTFGLAASLMILPRLVAPKSTMECALNTSRV